jgi:predicted pyridoxine 5'-phosphate oxidase superfamily flavin-nucleotide-binding protein
VVPVGLVEVLDDSTIAIVDVRMDKTRKNLAENDNVALAVTDVNRLVGYQFKGKAYVVSEGEIMEWAKEFVKRKQERRREAPRGNREGKIARRKDVGVITS